MTQRPQPTEELPLWQPFLHEGVVALRAPSQMWLRYDGVVGAAPIDGYYLGDVRVASSLRITVGHHVGEHIATEMLAADSVRFTALHRLLDTDITPDPDVYSEHTVVVVPDGARHTLRLVSRRDVALDADVTVTYRPDHSDLIAIKGGDTDPHSTVEVETEDGVARWRGRTASATLSCAGGQVAHVGDDVEVTWSLTVPAAGDVTIAWAVHAEDPRGVVRAPSAPIPWGQPDLEGVGPELSRWVRTALTDLDALRLVRAGDHEQFLAAGAPWFFTMFGRDALWAARLLLPLGTELAGSTLRALAALQGTKTDPDTAEQPGKILHELRPASLHVPGSAVTLPPLYYGTIDATPLWILLLADAAAAGLPSDEVAALLPALRAALGWLRDGGDADGDGLLEYVDESGHGLANQGWKDSGDSVQWRDGHLATAPLALCEVQGYAYAAARAGADVLDAYSPGEGAQWRDWAERLRERFHATFWVHDERGSYPAIALDAEKRPVDSLTSNIGHLLGTGILDAEQAALVAARLVADDLCSGYGLRTMSSTAAGYWPLSYHGGSVWTHDTAIAIDGLVREGFLDEARTLGRGLLAAATGFGGRVPELHSGVSSSQSRVPIPYPAACRPQAWSAAAAITVLGVLG